MARLFFTFALILARTTAGKRRLEVRDDEWLVVMKNGSGPLGDAALTKAHATVFHDGELGATVEPSPKIEKVFDHGRISKVKMALKTARALEQQPDVLSVEPDYIAHALESSPTTSWAIDRIDQSSLPLDGSYDDGTEEEGTGVRIYIVDTGIHAEHDEFTGRIAPGVDYVDGSGGDCHGHGTHCASTAMGTKYGVAKGATVVSVRALNCQGLGFYSNIIKGVSWAVDDANGVPAVISMSIGGPVSVALNEMVADAVAAGHAVIAAAGNSRSDACFSSPASAAAALTVGATTSSDSISSFSNHGSCVDVQAPGSDVLAAGTNCLSCTRKMSGTSMATPIVAGVVALVMARAGPSLKGADAMSFALSFAVNDKLSGVRTNTPNLLIQAPTRGSPSLPTTAAPTPLSSPTTSHPSAAPTTLPAPSTTPSRSPTAGPTLNPTLPTSLRSLAPTIATPPPSYFPTTSPPSAAPSYSPTTSLPSAAPTSLPSPSTMPSRSPTAGPTLNPTLPTTQPTRGPTMSGPDVVCPPGTSWDQDFGQCAVDPATVCGDYAKWQQGQCIPNFEEIAHNSTENNFPLKISDDGGSLEVMWTGAPTVSPTLAPSGSPTLTPSTAPSTAPSIAPTSAPSEAPTTAPTSSPSREPTATPSLKPTLAPSKSPTPAAPTPAVTAGPTAAPTKKCLAQSKEIGNGWCNRRWNTPECNYDGGDCCRRTCKDKWSWKGRGSCERAGFKCRDPCERAGDGWCNDLTNTAQCGYDGGDCCKATCVESWRGSCSKTKLNCKDPAHALPSTPPTPAPTPTPTNTPKRACKARSKGNGWCDLGNNHADNGCDYDGGDCCRSSCKNAPWGPSCLHRRNPIRYSCKDPNNNSWGRGWN